MIKRTLSFLLVLSFMLAISAPTAFAAKPEHAGGSKPGGGGGDTGGTVSTIGYDISYPQCGSKRLPKDHAFGIVGVNGGRTTDANKCLSEQLKWAASATGSTGQDKAQLYVNTANPGEVLEQYSVSTWPINNIDIRGNDSLNNENALFKNPYGACATNAGNYRGYVNDMACSWQYGWNRAVETVDNFFKPAARAARMSDKVSDYAWWLDVETMNSWQQEYGADGAQDPEGLAKNTATLEGMAQFYTSQNAKKVGIYSTGYQWGRITGSTVEDGLAGQNLRGLDSWLAGAFDEAEARSRCIPSNGLTPGSAVSLVQFVHKNLDHNVSCL